MRIAILAHAPSVHTVGWVRSIADGINEILVISLAPVPERVYSEIQGVSWADLGFQTYKRRRSLRKLVYLRAVSRIRKLVSDFHPDILHAHYASSYGLLGALAGFQPLIVSVWGSDVYDFPRDSLLRSWVLRWIFSRAVRILSTSTAMALETRKYSSRPIIVTPFGIDLNRFSPSAKQAQLFPGELVVGTTKSLEMIYGQEYLIRAFKLALDECPGIPMRLVIAGTGRMEERLRTLSEELGLGGLVSFLGFVPNEIIHEYHSRFDIFMSLSNEESFGVAALEAQACGKPVVATAVGGVPEVVQDGVTGFLVPPRNPQAAAAALVRLVADPDLRCKLGAAGRERTVALYDSVQCSNTRISMYDSVLGSMARSGGRFMKEY